MPSQSTLTKDEKDKVKAAVPSSSFKVQTAALARIYYAYPDPRAWSYSGIQGALAFVLDLGRGSFMFKMVDVVGTAGVTWEHELYDGFEYFEDRPYFHTFESDVRGLVFFEGRRLCTRCSQPGSCVVIDAL